MKIRNTKLEIRNKYEMRSTKQARSIKDAKSIFNLFRFSGFGFLISKGKASLC